MSDIIKGFKGLDKDFKCKDHIFEVDKEYTYKGDIKLCKSGFHFCENPFDIFRYYSPNESRYADVEAEDVSKEESDDSKRAAKTLRIKAEISIHALIDAGVKFILEKVDFKDAKESNTGYRSAAANTGKEGCAISLGIEGKAKGAKGCWLTLAEWKDEKDVWHRIDVQTVKVDGKKILADTFYLLKGGKFVTGE